METVDDPTVQAYVGVSEPSSASAPVAEQVSEVPTTTLELGEMLAVVMVGAVLPTETLAEELIVFTC